MRIIKESSVPSGGIVPLPPSVTETVTGDNSVQTTKYDSVHRLDSVANSDASNTAKCKIVAGRVYNAALVYMDDNEVVPSDSLFYGHTNVGEFSEKMTNTVKCSI